MDDPTYLLDMLNAARRVQNFLTGIDQPAFEASELHQWAVIKQLEVIGEAASRVSPACRDAHPSIPWHEIIGMRHRLVHDYTRIDLPTVWETAQQDIAPLITELTLLVPPEAS